MPWRMSRSRPAKRTAPATSSAAVPSRRVGNPPTYRFLAREQAESNGSKPWSRVSDHLWLTGNTYVLTSRDGPSLMIDPWDKRSADQFAKLQGDRGVGPLEVVMFSHAH